MKLFLARLAAVPIESAFAALILLASVAGLAHYGVMQDPLTVTFPGWLVTALLVLYGISGGCVLLGLGSGHGEVEAFGCALLIAGLVVRGFAIFDRVGLIPEVAVSLAFNAIFAVGYAVRLRAILRGEKLIRVKPE